MLLLNSHLVEQKGARHVIFLYSSSRTVFSKTITWNYSNSAMETISLKLVHKFCRKPAH